MIKIRLHRTDVTQITPTKERAKNASITNFDINSPCNPDVKSSQVTSNHLKRTQLKTKSSERNKKILKAGSVQENLENNDHYLDEVLHINIS